MSIIADYKTEDDLCCLRMSQFLDCDVLCFCINFYDLLTGRTHVQILWCSRFSHFVVMQESTSILENHTHWNRGNIFVQNVGIHLSDYMSGPGYHVMNLHSFESPISYTFTHLLVLLFIIAAAYVAFVLSNIDSITRDILKFSVFIGKCG